MSSTLKGGQQKPAEKADTCTTTHPSLNDEKMLYKPFPGRGRRGTKRGRKPERKSRSPQTLSLPRKYCFKVEEPNFT